MVRSVVMLFHFHLYTFCYTCVKERAVSASVEKKKKKKLPVVVCLGLMVSDLEVKGRLPVSALFWSYSTANCGGCA